MMSLKLKKQSFLKITKTKAIEEETNRHLQASSITSGFLRRVHEISWLPVKGFKKAMCVGEFIQK